VLLGGALARPGSTAPARPHAAPIAQGMLDCVFCIDTTGSMADDIQAVKDASREMIDELAKHCAEANVSLQLGLVTYQDHTDAEMFRGTPEAAWLRAWPLASESATIRRNILAIRVGRGVGGDRDEDLFAALMCAMDRRVDWEGQPVSMGWRPGAAKMILVMGDAPPHEPDFEGRTLEDVAARAEELDPVHVWSMLLPGQGGIFLDPTAKAMRRMAEATGGDVVRVAQASQLPAALVNTIKGAIERHRLEVWRAAHPPYGLYAAMAFVILLVVVGLAAAIVAQLVQHRRWATQQATQPDRPIDPLLTGQDIPRPPGH